MKKKQAYLITAYKDFPAVYELASFLCREDRVFIHVDKKSREIGEAELAKLNALPNCRAFCVYSVPWGGYAHIQAILYLMREAAAEEEVSYFHLLTGEDFPVQSPKRLHERFVDENRIYLSYIEEADFTQAVQKRIRCYNFFQNKNVKNPVLWQLQNWTVICQKLLGVYRTSLGEFDKIYKGLVYISMPKEAAADILRYLEAHPEYEKDLYRCQLPEEFFFQTLLLNEGFCQGKWKRLVVNRELRYMDWERGNVGSPAYLEESDYAKIAAGDYCFARKLHGEASEPLKEKIRENLW